MKKVTSMLLALLIAALAICAMSLTVFAAEPNDDVTDPYAKTTAPATTAAPATTKAPASQTAAINTNIVTNAPGQTAIDDGPETTAKKAAPVVNNNPSTGSSIIAPAIAFLALTAGVAAVVKTKKDED